MRYSLWPLLASALWIGCGDEGPTNEPAELPDGEAPDHVHMHTVPDAGHAAAHGDAGHAGHEGDAAVEAGSHTHPVDASTPMEHEHPLAPEDAGRVHPPSGHAWPEPAGTQAPSCEHAGEHEHDAGEHAAIVTSSIRDFELTVLHVPTQPRQTTGLEFHPLRNELWVMRRWHPTGLPCTTNDKRGCAGLVGEAVIITEPAGAAPSVTVKEDTNGWHYMRRPTALAFGEGELFASCHEARTGNFEEVQVDFIGPTLWTSDPAIFALEPPPGKNGSHIDMLHETPFCMGIAHNRENSYFAFNGQLGAVDLYDFRAPHEVGGNDHSDGELYRFVQGALLRQPEVPSHMALDRLSGELYVADSGHGRVVAIATQGATLGTPIVPTEWQLQVAYQMVGAKLREFVPPGLVHTPSGLTVAEGLVYVTDHETSLVHTFDRCGRELARLDTELDPHTLSGIAVDEEERIYLADLIDGRVLRLTRRP